MLAYNIGSGLNQPPNKGIYIGHPILF